MARIDLTEPYAIRTARKQVQESLQAHGEEVIGLRMFHANLDKGAERCPNCYDDVYKQAETKDCSVCYGTTFKGGVKQLFRMWAMFDDSPNVEREEKRGIWQSGDRAAQFEAHPYLHENDFFIRVPRWSHDHRPLQFGDAFAIGPVTVMSLRTGNQFPQTDQDRIGQKTQVLRMLPPEHIIHKVQGRLISDMFTVPRIDGMKR